MSNAGKGDRIRPFDQKKWDEGYERVFGRAKNDERECDNDEKPKGETNGNVE